ncbi:lipopolysaccharide transport periplasmic protein LptA [Lautropia mirabilis ATCC 51599]|jgi:lipopolysaccharide transport periplasmic protein lptA|uniref:Lipopolysaccharide export system protein LptA n=1 Tax=Lautropia mirabilis ATCC 51599 TaxID=887898 RepID=E7S0W3_9BURK|nr:lipopolysaccharide transport periplasmic protein LptA [Lautropia mirabilis]EFV93619.1 lipopolysaccharide transport periplasmic protein LptA [Lautropia mirabilis ATCC 51599]VEG99225.1 Lipopolysaccharide export system protein lptA precursor [Lautropia mirabilis]
MIPARPLSGHPSLLPLALALSALLLAPAAHAEKADRDKPINIESNRLEYNDATKVSTFIGNVVLTKGTIRITGDRMVLTQVGRNAQTARVNGNQASFRQKRDGMEQYIHGVADQIFYDTRTEQVTLTGRARLQRQNCNQPVDEITGGHIVYSASTETFSVDGQQRGERPGRVRIVIQPQSTQEGGKAANQPCKPGSPLPLQPEKSLSRPTPAQPTSRKP